MGIDEQGNAYINAKEEDLATFSILDNPYSLYWGSSSETGDTSYSYKPITESLNITKGEVVEQLELKKLHKISYRFYNDRKEYCGNYTIDVTVKGFDTPIRIIEENSKPGMVDISNHFENYLCIDIDNLKTFNLYLSHKNDNVSSEILFDASQVQNLDTAPEFYFDADSLLYIEPFVTARFDEYLEYYKGEPVYNEMYKLLRTGFNIFDIHKIKQVIPDDAEDSQYVKTYDFSRPYTDDEVVVKKFSNLSAVFMPSNDYSNCTINLSDNKNTNLTIVNDEYLKYKPPYYENVDNAGNISLFITNEDSNVVNFNIDSDFNTEDETTLRIQQMTYNTNNKLSNKITRLYLASNSLSNIRGSMPLKSLTLAITNELPERFQLGFIENLDLKELNLTDSQFKNIPEMFSRNNSLETLILNYTIESIGANAFDASYLNNIVLPINLKKIGFRGFYNIGRVGNITSLDFRDTQLETLGSKSLYSGASLKIYLPTTVTTIASDTFGPNTTVYYKGTATGAPWGAKEVITEF